MRYMLDTNICIYLIKNRSDSPLFGMLSHIGPAHGI